MIASLALVFLFAPACVLAVALWMDFVLAAFLAAQEDEIQLPPAKVVKTRRQK